MARAATTTDVFSAIAEPRRREIINLLGDMRGRPVGDLVDVMRLSQPAVSEHLGVLRKVGIVSVTRDGQQRLYRMNPFRPWITQHPAANPLGVSGSV